MIVHDTAAGVKWPNKPIPVNGDGPASNQPDRLLISAVSVIRVAVAALYNSLAKEVAAAAAAEPRRCDVLVI